MKEAIAAAIANGIYKGYIILRSLFPAPIPNYIPEICHPADLSWTFSLFTFHSSLRGAAASFIPQRFSFPNF
jgi:hypothetical protein